MGVLKMLGLVFQSVILILCSCAILEALKLLWHLIQDQKLKRECSVYESMMFKKELKKSRETCLRSNRNPHNPRETTLKPSSTKLGVSRLDRKKTKKVEGTNKNEQNG